MREKQLPNFLSFTCQTAAAKTSSTFAARPPTKEFWLLSAAEKLKFWMTRAWLLPSTAGHLHVHYCWLLSHNQNTQV